MSCASARVRGEKPCVPTCSDSSRFVFPTPFGPTASTSPGCSSSSSRFVTTEASELNPVDDQPGRRIGMTRYVKSSPSPWITPVVGADQLQAHIVTVHRLETVAQEVGVEADLRASLPKMRPASTLAIRRRLVFVRSR